MLRWTVKRKVRKLQRCVINKGVVTRKKGALISMNIKNLNFLVWIQLFSTMLVVYLAGKYLLIGELGIETSSLIIMFLLASLHAIFTKDIKFFQIPKGKFLPIVSFCCVIILLYLQFSRALQDLLLNDSSTKSSSMAKLSEGGGTDNLPSHSLEQKNSENLHREKLSDANASIIASTANEGSKRRNARSRKR